MAQFEALIVASVSLRTDTIYASDVDGLSEHLNTMMASDIGTDSWLFFHSLKIVAHPASGILVSFRPGVSMRVKCSNSSLCISYVTPLIFLLEINLVSPLIRFMSKDLPCPRVPSTMMAGFGSLYSAWTIYLVKSQINNSKQEVPSSYIYMILARSKWYKL